MAHRFGCLALGGAVLLALAHASEAAAQDINLPGPAEPGVERRERQLPTAPPSPPLGIRVPEISGDAPPGAENVVLVLERLSIEGVTVFEEPDLRPIYRELLGQQITLADIFTIAAQITRQYRDDGFILTRALVPAQAIENGNVRITVVEGFIGAVTLDDPDGREDGIRRRVRSFGERIRTARPIDIATLERYLLLANDLPGVTAEGILAPSQDQQGGSDLIIRIERDAFEGFVNTDKRGNRFVGRTRFQGGATANGVFGRAERSGARVITTRDTKELGFAEVLHEQPIGSEGLTAGVRGTLTRSDPGFSLSPLDVENRTRALELTATFPLIRSRRRNLILDGEFFYYDAKSDLLSERFSEDRIRALRFGGTFDMVDSFFNLGVNIVRLELSQGLDILGARETGSEDLSRAAGHSDFTKVNLDVSRLQNLAPRLNLLIAAAGQYAADPLLAVEEFCLGGRTFSRAYDVCEVAGDHGIAGRAELQLTTPVPKLELRPQLFAYYDIGTVWNKDSGIGTPARRSLASAGIGFRLNMGEKFSAEAEIAKPLTRDVAAEGNDDARFFFDLVARF